MPPPCAELVRTYRRPEKEFKEVAEKMACGRTNGRSPHCAR